MVSILPFGNRLCCYSTKSYCICTVQEIAPIDYYYTDNNKCRQNAKNEKIMLYCLFRIDHLSSNTQYTYSHTNSNGQTHIYKARYMLMKSAFNSFCILLLYFTLEKNEKKSYKTVHYGYVVRCNGIHCHTSVVQHLFVSEEFN